MITEDGSAPQWQSGSPRGMNLSATRLRAIGWDELTTLEGKAFTGGVMGHTRSGSTRPTQWLTPKPGSNSIYDTKTLRICSWNCDGVGWGKPEALLTSMDNPMKQAHVVVLLETGGLVPENMLYGYSTYAD